MDALDPPLLPEPDIAVLQADVVAIMANIDLIDDIPLIKNRAFDQVLAAWLRLDEAHRYVWRHRFGLDGRPLQQQSEIAATLGRSPNTVSRYHAQVPAMMTALLEHRTGFLGLPPTLRDIVLVYADGPEQLAAVINLIVGHCGFGANRFARLRRWLETNGHEALIEPIMAALTADSRRIIGI